MIKQALYFISSIFKRSHKISLSKCSNTMSLLTPPDKVSGMIKLDKEAFNKEITVSCLDVKDIKLSSLMPHLKKYMLKMLHFKAIEVAENNKFAVYLNPDIVKNWLDIQETDRVNLESLCVTENNVIHRSLTINYENYPVEEILKAILPSDKDGMSSFTKVGHIVHVNLREHLLQYKHLIGQILFDKVHGCQTVVNKVNMIDNTYRNFSMEILCGENNMIAKVKENNCTFEFDFSKVYWNSRLSTEHERIVKMLNSGDVLFDVFAGVGPFAITAAKKKCIVYANDLNPESHKWLVHNQKLNKINEDYLKTFCKDGREFILNDFKSVLKEFVNKRDIYITMNLPSMAVEFLNAFVGLVEPEELPEITSGIKIYVYCFAKGEDYVNIAKDLVIKNFGSDIANKIIDIFRVRTVSNFKEMMRVSILLDRNILVKQVSEEHLRKRKLEGEDTKYTDNKKSNNGEAEKEEQ